MFCRHSGNFKTSSPRHLGDDDPQIQAYLISQGTSPEPSEDIFNKDGEIRLYIPEIETIGCEDTDRSDPQYPNNNFAGTDDQSSLYEVLDRINVTPDHHLKSAPPSGHTDSGNNTPASVQKDWGKSYITAHNYLQNLFPKPQLYSHRSVYEVSSPNKADPTDNVRGRCTNVTAVLNKPITTPVEAGLKKRTTFRSGRSANCIRKVGKHKDTKKMNYIGGDMFSSSNHMTSGHMTSGHPTTGHPTTGHMRTSHMTTSSSNHMERVQEKEELQRLNDRFSMYVQRVRQLREQGGHIDSSAFLKTTKQLEDEVSNLKNLYEHELNNVR